MKRIALLLTIALGACQATPETSPETAPARVQSKPLSPQLRDAESVEGRELALQVIGDSGPSVLFLATIHGDESAGAQLVEELARRLQADPSLLHGHRALLVPVVNPDGLAAGTRRNAHNVDLNRNFPARDFQGSRFRGLSTLSEPEARFISDLVRIYQPTRILSFHQAADRIDYDGPGAVLAHKMAKSTDLEVKRMGTRPGSLGSWAGRDRQIPVLTIELPRSADELSPEEAWDAYGAILELALAK